MSCEYCRAIKPILRDESMVVAIDAMNRLHVNMKLGFDDESPVSVEKDARLNVHYCPMCGTRLTAVEIPPLEEIEPDEHQLEMEAGW